jgi:hypothetical protein
VPVGSQQSVDVCDAEPVVVDRKKRNDNSHVSARRRPTPFA